MPGMTIIGDDGKNRLTGGEDNDTLFGKGGDDLLMAMGGNDILSGGAGFDVLFGGNGNDVITGGTQSDFLYGEDGNDILFGDSGATTAKGADVAADRLDGGAGNDILVAGDGQDTLTGGTGADQFKFKYNNPVTAAAAGTSPTFGAVTDFNADEDKFVFDAAGLGNDANGANFVNNGSGAVGSQVNSFYKGAAAGANGESVIVIDDQAFTAGTLVAPAVTGEMAGDLLIYFNSTVGVASILYVGAPDMAVSFARITNITSLEQFQATNFSADDFLFA